MDDVRRTRLAGRAIAIPGDDLDTDRILPARFVSALTFQGVDAHLFADDRAELLRLGRRHPLDDRRFAGARILLTNRNFGCGSSREHAAQAISRWGIVAIVGESFSSTFLDNCAAIGLPAVSADQAAVEQLMSLSRARPADMVVVDLERMRVTAATASSFPVQLDEGLRSRFVSGTWDSLADLLAARDDIRAVASRLPYLAWK